MRSAFATAELESFRARIRERLGLNFDDSKLGFLAEVLARRLQASREPLALYLHRLEGANAGEELRQLALELSVTETYFFRNRDQFRAFAELVLPARSTARGGARSLKLLSAGCASGEEPYSLAILLREHALGWDASIRAVDLNPAMLEKALRGRYSAWALRETPAEVQHRWFRSEGRDFVLDESIRASVRFQERNLTCDDRELWAPESYDAVFCRNVLMYFSPDHARAVVARIARALAPGGYLFLGHAETLRGLSNDFHLCHTHETFYYQRRDGLSPACTDAPEPWPSWQAPSVEFPWASTWLETVQRASERIQALAEQPATGQEQLGPVGPSRLPVAIDLSVALELLKQERFAEALELLAQLPAQSPPDPELLLLHAVLSAHCGQLAAAERLCTELLQLDRLSSGAHYLLALCREGAGDLRAAVDEDQIAVYLDPDFAMPRLHLGLMARRAGELERARGELAQALLLLQREDPSRLLLFGGGFGREALIELCRAELAAAGKS